MILKKSFILLLLILFSVEFVYASGSESSTSLLNDLKVTYESNSSVPKTTVNVVSYYLQIWGPEYINQNVALSKAKLDIIESKKNELMHKREQLLTMYRVTSTDSNSNYKGQIDEIDFQLYGASYKIINDTINNFKKDFDNNENLKRYRGTAENLKIKEIKDDFSDSEKDDILVDNIKQVYDLILNLKKDLETEKNAKKTEIDFLNLKLKNAPDKTEITNANKALSDINNTIMDIDAWFSRIDSLVGFTQKRNLEIIKYTDLYKHPWIVHIPYFLPMNVYSSMRLESVKDEDLKKEFNNDFINPTGGTVSFNEYINYYLSKYSTATQYWTLSFSSTQSWLHLDDSNKKNYDIGVLRGNVDLLFIFPVFDEHITARAGKIQFGGGLSYGYYFGKNAVKELYSLDNTGKPSNNVCSGRLHVIVNLTDFLSFSAEYHRPFDKSFENCFYLSSTLARL